MWNRRECLAGTLALVAGVGPSWSHGVKRLILIGDSTVADYPPARYPLAGWGQMLRVQLANRLYVVNHAVAGSSSASFRQKKWEMVRKQLMPTDILLVQFGHVDALSDAAHPHVSIEQFQDNLRWFVGQANERGARVVLVTPVARHHFVDGRAFQVLQPYVDATRDVATQSQALLVDLSATLLAAMEKEGETETRQWFMLGVDGRDRVHFSRKGASIVGRMVARALEGMALV